jgi:hypothetical protein
MNFDEKTLAVWFIVTIPGEQDVMAQLSRTDEPGVFRMEWRFRYYSPESENPFDGKDRKVWQAAGMHGTEQEALESARHVWTHLATKITDAKERGDFYELVRGDKTLEEFFTEFRKAPFVHERTIAAGGAS